MHRSQAFTLIELSIVLLILSIILGGALTHATRKANQANWDETLARMDAIEKAILEYRRATDRLPCPSPLERSPTDTDFGTADTSTASSGTTCPSSTALSGGSAMAVSGDLPVRTLKLPAEYAFDGWGWRFTYAVDKRATLTGATFSTTYPIMDTDIGDIQMLGTSGDTLTNKAVVLIYSHGKNGHGAYSFAGVQRILAIENKDEAQNCNCGGASVNNTFVARIGPDEAGETKAYDDIVRYKTRPQLYSINPPETPPVESF